MLSESRGGRALQYVLVLVLAISLNFFLPRMMPGNPLALLAGVDVGLMTPEERAEVMAEAGLDRPLIVQYANYWGDLLQGDFGYSYRQKEPIADLILARLPYTLFLAGASLW
jgi:peptide/nickel transport system permease protein